MRRTLPLLAQLCALLLLMQWAIGAGACLAALRFDPAQTTCHPQPDSGSAPAMQGAPCPLCAPLPPSILPTPAEVTAPRILPAPATPTPIGTAAAQPQPQETPHQPRAPPIRT